MSKDTCLSGPVRAFPRPWSEDRRDGDQPDGNRSVHAQEGMTLRDYFAAKAMQAMIANPSKTSYGKSHVEPFAKYAYEYADAMLAERAK